MSWVCTYTGLRLDLADPKPESVALVDISHSLGAQPRWVGHTKYPLPVAQHCLCVRNVGLVLKPDLSPIEQLQFLLHDAHETYTGDIPSPLKALIPEIGRIQARIQAVIHEKFNIPPVTEEIAALIEKADLIMLEIERKMLMADTAPPWTAWEGAEAEVEPFIKIACPVPVMHGPLAAVHFNAAVCEMIKAAAS